MVAAVQVHGAGVHQFVGQQQHRDLQAPVAAVHKVAVEEVLRAPRGGEAVLREDGQQVRQVAVQVPGNDQLLVALGPALQGLHPRGPCE